MALNIISFNVRGLRDKIKRKKVFQFYNSKRCDVLCLQETHSVKEDEEEWALEWGGRILFSHGDSNARGVAILFQRGFSGRISEVSCDKDGRFVKCNIYKEEVYVELGCIYGPNRSKPCFYEEKIRMMHNSCENVILVGDYNVVLDIEKDCNNPNRSYDLDTAAALKRIMNELSLVDAWRTVYPEEKRFSWYRRTTKKRPEDTLLIQASRIDYGIVSKGMCNQIHSTMYLNGVGSDHSAFFIGFELKKINRGPGYWKFNTQYLQEAKFIQEMNSEIDQAIRDTEGAGAIDRWAHIKSKIKKRTQEYARKRTSENKVIMSQLSEYIVDCEDRVDMLNDQELDLLEKSKQELDELLQKNVYASMFRSKAKWYMESEKCSKYFFSLEKSRYAAKTCTAVFDERGKLCTDQKEILELQQEFYQELYTSDKDIRFQLPNNITQENTVPLDTAATDENQLSVKELGEALKGLKNGSCPGVDGLPAEVYKVFWQRLQNIYAEVVNECYLNNEMTQTMRLGILNLIPKGDKDTRHLKNLRPITLLNADYKIVEKAIANRMLPALAHIINADQTGFLPGRRISANIRKILDLIDSSERAGEDNVVISCDYMNCFDRIEIAAVEKAMKYFKFSALLRKWLTILYTNFRIKIQNCGNFSNTVKVTRGVHQGGPASNAYFLVIAELLAVEIRGDKNIKCAFVNEIKQLLNQYADDMDVSTRCEATSIRAVIGHIERFGQSTGFKLNYDKTTVYRVGSMKHTSAKKYTEGLNCTMEGLNILGVDVTSKPELLQINYDKVEKKVDDVLGNWANRRLSLIGKVQVINTLIASLFVYKMTVLPRIEAVRIQSINSKLTSFLWAGHCPKIATSTLQHTKDTGGLGLVDLGVKDDALKVSWIKMIFDGAYPHEVPHNRLHRELQEKIWMCNLHHKDVHRVILDVDQSTFWVDVLTAWCKYHYKKWRETPVLWLNSDIRVANAPIWWRIPASKGTVIRSRPAY